MREIANYLASVRGTTHSSYEARDGCKRDELTHNRSPYERPIVAATIVLSAKRRSGDGKNLIYS